MTYSKICMKVKLPLDFTFPVLSPLSSFKSLIPALLKDFCPGHSSASVQAWLPNQLQMKSLSPECTMSLGSLEIIREDLPA